jgi:hypothetical protein
MTVSPRLLAFEPDILFSSRIESVSHKLGITVKVVTSIDELMKELADSTLTALTLNLDALQGKIDELKGIMGEKSFPVFGYYSHVNIALADKAKGLGIEIVLPRGAFVAQFEKVLERVLSRSQSSS